MARTKNLKRRREREQNPDEMAAPVETERNEEVEVSKEALNPDPDEVGLHGDGEREPEEEEKEKEDKEDEEKEPEEKESEEKDEGGENENRENEVVNENDNEENEVVDENENEEEDDEGRSPSRTVSDPIDPPFDPPIDVEEDIEALQPLRMYFPTTEYPKKIKISTQCFINDVLKTFKDLPYPLTENDWKWFKEHPQFQHIFHMPEAKNHMVMGIWLLLLRTACIDRRKEAWFVVHGVPIRYGINEHALISGLNCCNYPLGYKEYGSETFVRKHISRKVIRLQDVKEKLVEMEPSRDRLKMAVLFFLASIIRGQTKSGRDATGVEPILLRAVGNLKYCKTFPWGRLSFDHMLKEISHTMSHFGGVVKAGIWPIPGFCIPLEHLVYEAIPQLHNAFRDDVPEADIKCPRMCKSKFKETYLKGFPLSEIYEQLGTAKDIESIITVREEENDLMREIIEEEDDVDVHDVVVNSWMRRLSKGYPVCFEEMYQADVDSRVVQENEDVGNEAMGNMDELVDLVKEMRAAMDARFTTIEEKFLGLEKRIAPLDEFVKKEKALQGSLMEESDEDVDVSPQPRKEIREPSGKSNEDGDLSTQPRKEITEPSGKSNEDVDVSPQPRKEIPEPSGKSNEDGDLSSQPRKEITEPSGKSNEETLGMVIAKKRSEIKSNKRKSYPRRPVTRSVKARVD